MEDVRRPRGTLTRTRPPRSAPGASSCARDEVVARLRHEAEEGEARRHRDLLALLLPRGGELGERGLERRRARVSSLFTSRTRFVCSAGSRKRPPKGQPEPTMMSAVIPRSRAPSAAAFTAAHHSGLSQGRSGKAARPSFGTSSRIAIVLISTPPMPAAFSTSSSRRISASVTREPFHHQRTKGRSREGGSGKESKSGSAPLGAGPRGHAQEAEEREGDSRRRPHAEVGSGLCPMGATYTLPSRPSHRRPRAATCSPRPWRTSKAAGEPHASPRAAPLPGRGAACGCCRPRERRGAARPGTAPGGGLLPRVERGLARDERGRHGKLALAPRRRHRRDRPDSRARPQHGLRVLAGRLHASVRLLRHRAARRRPQPARRRDRAPVPRRRRGGPGVPAAQRGLHGHGRAARQRRRGPRGGPEPHRRLPRSLAPPRHGLDGGRAAGNEAVPGRERREPRAVPQRHDRRGANAGDAAQRAVAASRRSSACCARRARVSRSAGSSSSTCCSPGSTTGTTTRGASPELLRGIDAQVNVIPHNPFPGSPYAAPSRAGTLASRSG